MSTSVRYSGPEGQANHEIGKATGEGDLLTPGNVYDVPEELADKLVDSSAWFERVQSFDDLNQTQLRQLASERGITGASRMKSPELIAALRGDASTTGGDS